MAGVEKKKAVVAGHGDYRTIAETDFLKEVCTTNKVVVHFPQRFRAVQDHGQAPGANLRAQSRYKSCTNRRGESSVLREQVGDSCPSNGSFLTNGISCPIERIVGFDGLPNGDNFTTRDLEEVMVRFEVLAEAKFPETDSAEHVEDIDKVKGQRIASGSGGPSTAWPGRVG